MNLNQALIGLMIVTASRVFAAETAKPYMVGALGDSITAGFNTYRFGDNRDLSWAVGLDRAGLVTSHAKRLQQILNRPVEIHNEAFVGAVSSDLTRETDRLVRYKPDYVTFMIGANDLCEWDEDDFGPALTQYRQRVTVSLKRLIAANPQVKIVMAALPDLMRVYRVGAAHQCQARWDSMGLCRPLFDSKKTEADREAFGERLTSLNETIEDIAEKFPQNIRFKGELASFEFPWEFLSSIDCFHPSVLGHNKIAELTFDPEWF